MTSISFPAANNKRTFAITGLRFAVDDIMNTLFLVEPDGSINYNNIQAFSSADYAFLFSFAQKLKESEKKNHQQHCLQCIPARNVRYRTLFLVKSTE
jgi:hypothetical protein